MLFPDKTGLAVPTDVNNFKIILKCVRIFKSRVSTLNIKTETFIIIEG